MTVDNDSCRKSATAIVAEFHSSNPDIDSKVLQNLEDLMIKHMTPVMQAIRSAASSKRTPSKPKSEKGSSRPNYYAFFHSACCPKGIGYSWIFEDYTFKYQPNPDSLKSKQRSIYDNLHMPENEDKLQRVMDFRSNDLKSVVEFVEKELDVSQMTRTSLIWYQFLSQDDRDRFSSWYKKTITENGEIPTKFSIHVPTIKASTEKIPARIRMKGSDSETDPEPETNSESEPETEQPLTNSETDPEPETKPEPLTIKSKKITARRRQAPN